MENKSDLRRRWLGGACLGAALIMLIVGMTVLHNRFSPIAFIVYWMVCFVFTGLAILVALLDWSAVRRRTHDEQRELVESTLREIVREKEARSKRPGDRKPR